MEAIDDQLKAAIKKSGVPVADLARECGIHRQVIDRFLAGERGMRLGTAAKIASHLRLSLTSRHMSKPARK
jgi:ribosome-binding protein aMBF1 (putative translation factor)